MFAADGPGAFHGTVTSLQSGPATVTLRYVPGGYGGDAYGGSTYGGTAYGGKLKEGLTVAKLRPLVDENHQKNILSGAIDVALQVKLQRDAGIAKRVLRGH